MAYFQGPLRQPRSAVVVGIDGLQVAAALNLAGIECVVIAATGATGILNVCLHPVPCVAAYLQPELPAT